MQIQTPWIRLVASASSPSFHHRSFRIVVAICVATLGAMLLNIYYFRRNATPAGPRDMPFYTGCQTPDTNAPRENATFLMLGQNDDLEGAVKTLTTLEKQFNHWARYPIVFLNDRPWNQDFIDGVKKIVSGDTYFGVVGKDMWGFPDWIDQNRAGLAMDLQEAEGVYLAGHASYHHMCRFYSGMFYDHELMRPFKWYWRIEPNVRFTCAMTYDPFAEMKKRRKKYGYIVALWELADTVPTLFRKISDWKKAKDIKTSGLWKAMIEFSWAPWPFRLLLRGQKNRDADGSRWNLCHFFNNFEIADMDFFRSDTYRELFSYLDHDGGFYYERWGDAPVHSLAAALLLNPTEIHHFTDFGYEHAPFQYCPYMFKSGSTPNLAQTNKEELEHIGCNSFDCKFYAIANHIVSNGPCLDGDGKGMHVVTVGGNLHSVGKKAGIVVIKAIEIAAPAKRADVLARLKQAFGYPDGVLVRHFFGQSLSKPDRLIAE